MLSTCRFCEIPDTNVGKSGRLPRHLRRGRRLSFFGVAVLAAEWPEDLAGRVRHLIGGIGDGVSGVGRSVGDIRCHILSGVRNIRDCARDAGNQVQVSIHCDGARLGMSVQGLLYRRLNCVVDSGLIKGNIRPCANDDGGANVTSGHHRRSDTRACTDREV